MDELPRELPAREGEGTVDGGPEDTTPVSPSSRITSGDWMVTCALSSSSSSQPRGSPGLLVEVLVVVTATPTEILAMDGEALSVSQVGGVLLLSSLLVGSVILIPEELDARVYCLSLVSCC